MRQLGLFLAIVAAAGPFPVHRGKDVFASIGPITFVLASATQLDGSIASVALKPQLHLRAKVLNGSRAAVGRFEGLETWDEDGSDDELSFLQAINLKDEQKMYKKLKKQYKKRHSNEDFLRLKYEAMNRALKKANEHPGK